MKDGVVVTISASSCEVLEQDAERAYLDRLMSQVISLRIANGTEEEIRTRCRQLMRSGRAAGFSTELEFDDVIILVRAIRTAEYVFKKIDEWIDNFQVGPGVSLKLECQFLAGRINAKWGYTEYTDERVFLAIAGAIKIDLIKASVDVNAGWKCAGLADAFITLKGEGTLSLNLPAVEKTDPDTTLHSSVKAEGELKLSGGVHGAFGWVITGDVGFEVTFKADTEDFKVLCEKAILKGKILISREPVFGVFTCSCLLWGTTTKKVPVMEGNERVGEFVFGGHHA
jgi:hypothetical protein